ncbi:MAG: hypothetical protein VX454_11225 [Pseudomonadota bacterium]|nr:hypothetical protein [Pseudomonadota bacterium]
MTNQPLPFAHDETLRAMAAAIYASIWFDDVSLSFERAERRRTSEYRQAVGAAQQALAAASRVRERERRQLPLL